MSPVFLSLEAMMLIAAQFQCVFWVEKLHREKHKQQCRRRLSARVSLAFTLPCDVKQGRFVLKIKRRKSFEIGSPLTARAMRFHDEHLFFCYSK
jgi:hypothetical protein